MLDRYGYVWTASSDKYELDEQPLAYVGPGRPLGFHFTATGDLVICDSLKVPILRGSVGACILELVGTRRDKDVRAE